MLLNFKTLSKKMASIIGWTTYLTFSFLLLAVEHIIFAGAGYLNRWPRLI